MEKDERFVYVSGKYTDDSLLGEIDNIAYAEGVGKILASYDINVYVPHMATCLWDDINNYRYFMNLHKSFLDSWATDIYMMSNYEDSNGALEELELAQKNGLNVWYEIGRAHV